MPITVRVLFLVLCASLLHTSALTFAQSASATETELAPRPGYQARSISRTFRIPKGIKDEVHFWSQVYGAYDRNQIIIHDPEDLGRIYDVIDVSDIAPLGDPFAPFSESVRERRAARVKQAKAKVQRTLLALAERKGRARGLYAKKIKKAFGKAKSVEDYQEAADDKRLRSQTGLKDRFIAGIARSGRYMDQIDAIFAEEGVPWEITRLAFVESMFDLRAYSKVGASGVWQFMPGTAKIMGLALNDVIDERNDPIAATRAAARLLMKNYRYLDSWPLAINAYNAGPGRLKQAVKAVGTKDIAKIIHRFEHRAYGFASRNFYPTFLAALYTFEKREQHFGTIALEAPQTVETIITQHAVQLPALAKRTGLSLDDLWQLNPGYASEIYDGSLDLPAGHTLRIPEAQSRKFLAAIDRLRVPVASAE